MLKLLKLLVLIFFLKRRTLISGIKFLYTYWISNIYGLNNHLAQIFEESLYLSHCNKLKQLSVQLQLHFTYFRSWRFHFKIFLTQRVVLRWVNKKKEEKKRRPKWNFKENEKFFNIFFLLFVIFKKYFESILYKKWKIYTHANALLFDFSRPIKKNILMVCSSYIYEYD